MKARLIVFVLVLAACGGGDGGPPNIEGFWQGVWFSDTSNQDGTVGARFVQDFETVGGTLGLGNSPCFNQPGQVTGHVSEFQNQFFGRVDFPNGRIDFDATVSNGITGTYQVVSGSCTGDFGDFILGRQ